MAVRTTPWTIFSLADLFAVTVAVIALGCLGGSDGTATTSLDPPAEPDPPGEVPAFPFVAHVDQGDVTSGKILFDELFILGDELFEVEYSTLDGSGALRLPNGCDFPERFSRIPPGCGRFTGPNGQSCVGCHNTPLPTSAGGISSNVLQDPARDGSGPFNVRNPTHLFGSGVLQVLAAEMTEDLQRIRGDAAQAAVAGGAAVVLPLTSKDISFGTIAATRDAGGSVSFDTSQVAGVDPDLVIRPYGWKGNVTTLRDFCRDAARGELGMEGEELVIKDNQKDPTVGPDPDGDLVETELSVGDITAITIYVAAQPVPTDISFLVSEGLEPPPTPEVSAAVVQGEQLFAGIGCASCHVPELRLDDPVFEEPTRRGGGSYLDGDLDPAVTALDPDRPFRFHLVQEGESPRLEPHPAGGARVRLFGDLKRHDIGSALADPQRTPVSDARGEPLMFGGAPVEVAVSVFLTAELWGVGNTGPWLHDGRAASLEEAVRLHGGEAQTARDNFVALSDGERAAVIEFLESLVLAAPEGEDED